MVDLWRCSIREVLLYILVHTRSHVSHFTFSMLRDVSLSYSEIVVDLYDILFVGITTDSMNWYCPGCDVNGKYCALSGTQTHISGIPGQCASIAPCRLLAATTRLMPTCLCGSLPQRSVQTSTLVPLELLVF